MHMAIISSLTFVMFLCSYGAQECIINRIGMLFSCEWVALKRCNQLTLTNSSTVLLEISSTDGCVCGALSWLNTRLSLIKTIFSALHTVHGLPHPGCSSYELLFKSYFLQPPNTLLVLLNVWSRVCPFFGVALLVLLSLGSVSTPDHS